MSSKLAIVDHIASVSSETQFANMASRAFEFQLANNVNFKHFVQQVYGTMAFSLERPPFVPVELFKHHRMSCHDSEAVSFLSSGSTGFDRAAHPIYDIELYEALSVLHFESLYGALSDHVILALLPSYLQNGDSSLVFMVDRFIRRAHPSSAFVLHDLEELKQTLERLRIQRTQTLLIGVSYALLDLAEQCTFDFPKLTIMETGGMKGRRKELTRQELHEAIAAGFPSSEIHSEYGMTELLSQGYMKSTGGFNPPPWMKAYCTDISDPLQVLPRGKRGLLAFVDLANYHSCSFIQTRDIGVVNEDGSFRVEGRLDHSDLRGCNLLYT